MTNDNVGDDPILILCRMYEERWKRLIYIGKRRDEDCVAFFCGAGCAFDMVGDTTAYNAVWHFTSQGIVKRGYQIVKDYLTNATKQVN